MADQREALRAPDSRRVSIPNHNNVVDMTTQRDHGKPHSKLAPPWLADLVMDGSPRNLMRRLGEFRGSVHRSLLATSKEYRVLATLELARLSGTEACEAELRQHLAGNAHFILLSRLSEAEKAVAELGETELTVR